MPIFNMRGQDSVKTNCGACVSLLILTLFILYTLLKLEHLALRKNPSINIVATTLEPGERFFNTGHEDFTMAFAVRSGKDDVPKSDTRYIQWVVYSVSRVNQIEEKRELPLHPCSDAELAKFDPPQEAAADEVNELQAGGHLFCFDW